MGNKAKRRPRPAGGGDNLFVRAVTLHKAGDLAAAERQYRQVGRRDRHYGEALRQRGLIAYQNGDVPGAIKLMRRAVVQQRTNPVFHDALAQALRAGGDLDGAIASYRRAWRLLPEREQIGMDLARTLAEAGDVDGAIATWRKLLPNAPDPGLIHTRIAKLYSEHGCLDAADETLAAWRAQAGDDAQTWYELGRAYSTIGRPDRAIYCYRAAIEREPDHARACAGLGSALTLRGDNDAACVWLRKAIELEPALGWVYLTLTMIRSFEWPAGLRRQLQRLAEDANVAESERVNMQFALGTLDDRAGAHEQAFRHFDLGNSMHARRRRFDRAEFDRRVERMLRLFDAAFFRQRADYGVQSARPLFIVGMPRSGTSLVEQIIASHPQAHGAGELAYIGSMVRELPAMTGGKRHPDSVAAMDRTQARALAERYLAALEHHNADAMRVTDKMPLNLMDLGFIALLLPGARIVYCRRDAMDNCLSCFVHAFHDGMAFTYDQAHLGHVYRQHERLMAHWADCLPLDMLTVDYEQLVADQETQSRRLIEFAGLPWDDRCLAFHETARDVQTASTWQVRQPMYQSSVARWRAYERWLGPLRDSLRA